MLDCVSRDKNRIENVFLIKAVHNNFIEHFHDIFYLSFYLEYRLNKSKIILYTRSVIFIYKSEIYNYLYVLLWLIHY